MKTWFFVIVLVLGGVAAYYYMPVSWWQPKPGLTWQWQLTQYPLDTSLDVAVYNVDLFNTPAEVVQQLHEQDKKVICHFSAGTWEPNRPDSNDFPKDAIGNTVVGWPKEKWLNYTDPQVLELMERRFDLAETLGCDGVEPDNVDGYEHDMGFPLSGKQQLVYNKWLAKQAHRRDLSVGLKNNLEQIPQLINDFDWALNEECYQYHTCHKLKPFIDQNKAVFWVEYEGHLPSLCHYAQVHGYDLIKKDLALTAWREDCATND